MFFLKNQKEVLQKFFFSLVFACFSFVLAVICTEMDHSADLHTTLLKILAVSALGISIGFGIEFLEIPDPKKRLQARLWGLSFLILQVLISWFVIDVRRFSFLYANLFLLAHLFVALSFWYSHRSRHLSENARNQYFWNQNWRLFIGFQSAALINAVLFLGLVLGIASLDFLFGYKPPERTYLYLFYALSTVGGVFYLGAFFIEDLKDDSLQNQNESKILSTLVRYIFPLLQILYFLILYLYLIKIILSWSLPRGYVGWLVSGLSILICLSHLIIKPVQEKFSAHRLMQMVWRSSFVLMLPLLGLMFVSLFRRIDDYGLTEKRYILVVLTLWMTYTALTHLKPQKAKLQSIPLSLFLVALVTTTGPFNSYSISLWSQSRRLQSHLQDLQGQFKNNELVFHQSVASAEQIRFVRTMKSICDTYGVTRLYQVLGSDSLPVVLPSQEHQCVYRNEIADTQTTPFGKLVKSTQFEVLADDRFLYYHDGDPHVDTDEKKTYFHFTPKKLHRDEWIEAFGYEAGTLVLTSYDSEKRGLQQLRFQKTLKDQITWVPEKGSLKVIDLQPLMKKLAQTEKTYVFEEHPEDQNIELSNEISKVKLRIVRFSFRLEKSGYEISDIQFFAVAMPKLANGK